MDYTEENLSMLSAIYRLLGRRNSKASSYYYQKAENYAQKLLAENMGDSDKVRERQLLSLVSIKEKLGKNDEAIACLEQWEKEHGEDLDDQTEVYRTHTRLLANIKEE